jgi:hypothetical protein
MVPGRVSLRCRRCSGRMVPGLDGHSCLVCGHVDYGPDFKPLELTIADARRLERLETEGERGLRSPYRRNDHADDFARSKGRPGYLDRAPAIE